MPAEKELNDDKLGDLLNYFDISFCEFWRILLMFLFSFRCAACPSRALALLLLLLFLSLSGSGKTANDDKLGDLLNYFEDILFVNFGEFS